jgi:hypothetical protein
METLSYPMCVQLSSQLVTKWPGADAHIVLLGDRPVKGKGKMTTYLLKVCVRRWNNGAGGEDRSTCGSKASHAVNALLTIWPQHGEWEQGLAAYKEAVAAGLQGDGKQAPEMPGALTSGCMALVGSPGALAAAYYIHPLSHTET